MLPKQGDIFLVRCPCKLLDTFLPITSMEGMPSSVEAFSDIPAGAMERDIYNVLVRFSDSSTWTVPYRCTIIQEKCLNSQNGARCPGYRFVLTPVGGDGPVKLNDRKPDLCVYDVHTSESNYTTNSGRRYANLVYAHMFIEIKGHESADFFKDPPLPKRE